MNPSLTTNRYSKTAMSLHWLSALLVVAAFIYGPGGPELRVYAASRDFERQLHETLGMGVFALTLLRLAWRCVDHAPDAVPVPRWMALSATATKWLLMALMLALPLTAITGAWLQGHPLTLLGGLVIPARIAASHALGNTFAELHGWLGDAILWLAGLHATAAIYHHKILRDGVLASMLPLRAAARSVPR